jgi:viroplasmin and RNaseH domain-containing protein
MTWYVVHCGRQIGGFSAWEACHASVNFYKGACYKGYKTKEEAFAAFFGDGNKECISRVGSQPMKRLYSWKDKIILVEGVIICMLLLIIWIKL